MAQQNQIQMPGVFGGLTRYDSESGNRLSLTPQAVIAFLVAIVAFVVILKVFWPVN